ncbi:hypothetical protein TNCV_2432641 [Trichonephila clavipes]|nr:hypothetical protein TNCV_2432641 [Trichonephila clavipes]
MLPSRDDIGRGEKPKRAPNEEVKRVGRDANYNTKEALDFSIASSDLGPSYKWTLLENLESDHLPILIELKKRQLVPNSINKQWIFKKVDRQSFAEAVDNGIKSILLKDSVDLNRC